MTHLWIPKIKIAENRDPIILPSSRVEGYFRIVARKDDGRERVLVEQSNHITTAGLNRWGTGGVILDGNGSCVVGTGSPTPGDTSDSLVAPLGYVSTFVTSTYNAQASEPYFSRNISTYRFSPPEQNRTLSEIGFGWTAGLSGSLWSLSLIDPAITWLTGETLEVTYELRRYPWAEGLGAGTPYTMDISGVEYSGVIKAARVTSYSYWAPNPFLLQRLFTYFNGNNLGVNAVEAYAGTIGVVTGIPSGVSVSPSSVTENAYSSNSFKRTGTCTWGPTKNLSGEVPIRSLYAFHSSGTYQMSIGKTSDGTGIPKVTDWTLVLNVESPSWGRA